MQFSFLSPLRKGGWGDFGTPRAGKSPLAPLCKGGNGAYHRKLNDPGLYLSTLHQQAMGPRASDIPGTQPGPSLTR